MNFNLDLYVQTCRSKVIVWTHAYTRLSVLHGLVLMVTVSNGNVMQVRLRNLENVTDRLQS